MPDSSRRSALDRDYIGGFAHDSPARQAASPGKRTLTARIASPASTSARAEPGYAPAQCAPEPSASIDDWSPVVFRPDLYDAPVQAKARDGDIALASPAESNPPAQATAPTAGGHALPAVVQAKMEHAFDSDFSNVRVHTGAHVTALGARAYAQGDNLHFAPGHYDPHGTAGQELLGHELAHVVQQRAGRVAATGQASGLAVNTSSSLEREADELGACAARGEHARVAGGGASARATVAQGAGLAVIQGAGISLDVEEDTNKQLVLSANTKVTREHAHGLMSTEGAHTTADVVFRDTMERALQQGMTLDQAATTLKQVYNNIENLPGHQLVDGLNTTPRKHYDSTKQDAKDAKTKVDTAASMQATDPNRSALLLTAVQRFANTLQDYRNMVPLTAVKGSDGGSTTGGEKSLRSYERNLEAEDAKTSNTTPPPGPTNAFKDDAEAATELWTMLDMGTLKLAMEYQVHDNTEESIDKRPMEPKYFIPGLDPWTKDGSVALALLVVRQFVSSVQMAYPRVCAKHSFPGSAKAKKELETRLSGYGFSHANPADLIGRYDEIANGDDAALSKEAASASATTQKAIGPRIRKQTQKHDPSPQINEKKSKKKKPDKQNDETKKKHEKKNVQEAKKKKTKSSSATDNTQTHKKRSAESYDTHDLERSKRKIKIEEEEEEEEEENRSFEDMEEEEEEDEE